MGMFIAKTIIDSHSKTISVSSEHGHICEFTFTPESAEPLVGKGRVGAPQGGITHE
ncbi:MAG: HAMP domain-containing histidine kinase [Clostridia bacterium]|nr:HAMP domain-containing histidine kinase [Clostridia bacterium]